MHLFQPTSRPALPTRQAPARRRQSVRRPRPVGPADHAVQIPPGCRRSAEPDPTPFRKRLRSLVNRRAQDPTGRRRARRRHRRAPLRAVLSDHSGQAGPPQPPLRAATRPQQPTWTKTCLEARKRSRSVGRRPKRGLLAHTAVTPHSGRRDRRLGLPGAPRSRGSGCRRPAGPSGPCACPPVRPARRFMLRSRVGRCQNPLLYLLPITNRTGARIGQCMPPARSISKNTIWSCFSGRIGQRDVSALIQSVFRPKDPIGTTAYRMHDRMP